LVTPGCNASSCCLVSENSGTPFETPSRIPCSVLCEIHRSGVDGQPCLDMDRLLVAIFLEQCTGFWPDTFVLLLNESL
jgi:hypothetical protein